MATETIAEGALVDMVLEECHAPLRGRMDRIATEIRLPDGELVQAVAALPHSLRIVTSNGQFLRCKEGVFVLGESPRAVTAAETARLQALLELVDRAAFGPLHRAMSCRRLGPASFELGQDSGPAVTLRLREHSLLPAAFGCGGVEVTIDDYLRTPATWIASRATHPSLGSCEVVFELAGTTWREDLFDPPTSARSPRGPRVKYTTETVDSRSPSPVLIDSQAVRWLVLDDPGDWDGRCRVYRPRHELLLAEKQRIAGFPILTRIDDRPVLAIPFRAREPDDEPDLPPGCRVVTHAAGRDLEVWPPDGDFEARCRAAEQLLLRALEERKLEAETAIRYQPFVHLEDGVPTAEKLAAPVVRAWVRVR